MAETRYEGRVGIYMQDVESSMTVRPSTDRNDKPTPSPYDPNPDAPKEWPGE